MSGELPESLRPRAEMSVADNPEAERLREGVRLAVRMNGPDAMHDNVMTITPDLALRLADEIDHWQSEAQCLHRRLALRPAPKRPRKFREFSHHLLNVAILSLCAVAAIHAAALLTRLWG